jgi:hypothetical protein
MVPYGLGPVSGAEAAVAAAVVGEVRQAAAVAVAAAEYRKTEDQRTDELYFCSIPIYQKKSGMWIWTNKNLSSVIFGLVSRLQNGLGSR